MATDTPEYIAGLDLGQQGDYTALTLIQRAHVLTGEPAREELLPLSTPPPEVDMGAFERAIRARRGGSDFTRAPAVERRIVEQTREEYHLRHLERPPLGTPYPALVDLIVQRLATPPLAGATTLVMDVTGVGRPVYDLFRLSALRAPLVAVTITAGDTATQVNGSEWHVPKRDLVSALQVMLQTGKLKIAGGLPLAETFRAELMNFKAKINLRGHDSYEAGNSGPGGAWREAGRHDDIVLAVALACWQAERPQPRIRWIDYD